MSQLLNIFLEPGKVFAELKEKPTFLAPALIVAVAMIAATTAYFLTVDPAWFSAHQLAQIQAGNPEISKADLDQMAQFMPGARMSATFTWAIQLVGMVVVYCVFGLYYFLAGKIAGQSLGFRHGLALTAWSSMPMLFSALVLLAGIFTSPADTALESLQLLNVDPLLVQLPMDSPWSTLAKSFSLLSFWCWFLAALGWKTWTRGSWGGALFVALLPAVVIYGIWALIAAL